MFSLILLLITFTQENRTNSGLYADHDGKGSIRFSSFKGTDCLSFGVGRKVAGSKDREGLAVQQGDIGADGHRRTVGCGRWNARETQNRNKQEMMMINFQ